MFTLISSMVFTWYINVFLLREQQWSTTTPTTTGTTTTSRNGRREPSSNDDSCSDPTVQFLTIASHEEQLIKRNGTLRSDNSQETSHFNQKQPLQPLQPQPRTPKVLCCIVTHQDKHNTSAQAIWDTWGQKCDHLIMSSNANDPSIHAIDMKARPGYEQLWHKLELALQYLQSNYYDNNNNNSNNNPPQQGDGGGGDGTEEGAEESSNLQFDWILKADDDTYVIMENLKAFLAYQRNHDLIPQVYNTAANIWEDAPMVYGRTMPYPTLRTLFEWENWFTNPHNYYFGHAIRERYNIDTTTLLYPHGGPGYIMNWKYLQVLLAALTTDSPNERVRGKMPDDMASALTMLYRGIQPTSTRDSTGSGSGLERSHPEPPQVMYDNPPWLQVAQVNIENTGYGENCCAPSSISYHHLDPEAIRRLHYQLYTCPKTKHKNSY
jgi:hypothetical protein